MKFKWEQQVRGQYWCSLGGLHANVWIERDSWGWDVVSRRRRTIGSGRVLIEGIGRSRALAEAKRFAQVFMAAYEAGVKHEREGKA